MPTGYTAKVQDGSITEFEDFALQCARAMGACIMQRDDASDALPELEKPSPYHAESIQRATEQLERLDGLTRDQIIAECEREVAERRSDYEGYIKDKEVQKARYELMLEQVHAWTPPTPDHVNFKNFMIEQLTTSLDYDCNSTYWEEELAKVEDKDPIAWFNDAVAQCHKDIEYHTERQIEEQKAVDSRNEWKKALFESLGRTLV